MLSMRRVVHAFSLCIAIGAGPALADITDLPIDAQTALKTRDYAAARELLTPLAAVADAAEAQFNLAVLLIDGRGGAVDQAQGYALLDQAASNGHGPAAVLLARVFMTGKAAGVERDTKRAARLLAIAADQSNSDAQFYLAALKLKGDGTAQDTDGAMALLNAAAEQGNTDAQYELSILYSNGKSVPPDYPAALRWLMAAAEAGKLEAQYFLANAYYTGKGIAQDRAAALRWFRRAAEQGMPVAQRILGTAYLTGEDGVARNTNEALRWLTSAATAGEPGAMFNLATAYDGQHGVPRNDTAALEWLQMASKQELARATFMLAQFIEAGRGTPADIKTAAKTYRTAYEQGDERGALRLGALTAKGALDGIVPPHFSVPWTVLAARAGDEGAQRWLAAQAAGDLRPAQAAYGVFLLDDLGNPEEAVVYLKPAAQAGAPEAQHRLGQLFTTGEGVDLDYVAAHKWLNIAATNGIAEAAETRDVISALMTPEQLAQAQDGARAFFDAAQAPAHETVEQDQ